MFINKKNILFRWIDFEESSGATGASAPPTASPTSLQVCFSGSSHVESNNNNNGTKLMSEMKLGDEILSYNRKTKVK